MTAARFYVPGPLRIGEHGVLDANQSKQVRNVLRQAAGRIITVFNGEGVEAEASIASMAGGTVRFEVRTLHQIRREPPLELTVGLALLKGDRFETAVQKLTELGVRAIVPLITQHNVVTFRDAQAWAQRSKRWQRIAIEAAEQCERCTLPQIAEPQALAEFLAAEQVIALVERSDSKPLACLGTGAAARLAIGPEGGWSADEVHSIVESGATVASLGALIYRAETAAIVAAGTLIQRSWATTHERREP